MQFFCVSDLCKAVEKILDGKCHHHVINVGNENSITVRQWVELCYDVTGKKLEIRNVEDYVKADVEQRKFFPFYEYEYCLDVSRQKELGITCVCMEKGLQDAFSWYLENQGEVNKRNGYLDFLRTLENGE